MREVGGMIGRLCAGIDGLGARAVERLRRELDASLLRAMRYQDRIEQLVAAGKSPEEAIAEVEHDVAAGRTGEWKPIVAPGRKAGKGRR